MKTSTQVFEGSTKNVWKYIFYNQRYVAEAVLFRYDTFYKRTVICCATQSGCQVGCRFCGAGKKFICSLSEKEISDQIDFVLNDKSINASKVKKLQFMFMSMGEPMLNFDNVALAISALSGKHPNAELLISTIGIDDDSTMKDLFSLSKKFQQLGLQFSVHASTDRERDRLIPYKKKLTLDGLAKTGRLWHGQTGRFPYINYCVSQDNCKPEDAKRLARIFDPEIFHLTLSVICEKEAGKQSCTTAKIKLINKFKNMTDDLGFETSVFNPAGQDDIGGGCGQLWFVQEWFAKHGTISVKQNEIQ